jgi:hypothetical protein
MLLVYLATSIGIMASVQIDRFIWHYDRGVWIIEIVIVLALAALPLVVGAAIAKIWRTSQWRHSQPRGADCSVCVEHALNLVGVCGLCER